MFTFCWDQIKALLVQEQGRQPDRRPPPAADVPTGRRSPPAADVPAGRRPDPKLVVGYYASWRCYGSDEERRDPFLPSDIRAECFTHLIYAFAKINDRLLIDHGDEWADTQRVFDVTGPDGTKRSYTGLIPMFNGPESPVRARNPGLKVLIGVGGWTFSKNFSDAVADEPSRERFAASVAEFVVRHGFDGVDIDWEYPCVKGHDHNKVSPHDGTNLSAFVFVLRRHLAQAAAQRQRPSPYVVSMATSPSSWSYDHLELGRLGDLVDFCNIMCYDGSGSWSESIAHHAPLIPLVTNAAKAYIDRGMPANKICIGIPLYGRAFNQVSQPRIGSSFGSVAENDGIVEFDVLEKDRHTFEQHCDESAGGAISFWHPERRMWVSTETVASASRKADWIRQENLGGVFFWEVSMDRQATVVEEVRRHLFAAT